MSIETCSEMREKKKDWSNEERQRELTSGVGEDIGAFTLVDLENREK